MERLLAGEALTAGEQLALFESRDLLSLGMAADEVRRRRHGATVTFVRVADVAVEHVASGAVTWEGSPGEIRIVGAPADLSQAIAAVSAAVTAAGAVPVTAFSLRTSSTPRALEVGAWLAALRQTGLAAVAEAPVDELESPERLFESMEEPACPWRDSRSAARRRPAVRRCWLARRR